LLSTIPLSTVPITMQKLRGIQRGVVHCPLEHKLHSDLNGALNILKKAINLVVSAIRKPLSFIVDHNRVAPVIVTVKGCNP